MKRYSPPMMTVLGSLHELTLDNLPGGDIHKNGGGSDVISAATGLGGTFEVTPAPVTPGS